MRVPREEVSVLRVEALGADDDDVLAELPHELESCLLKLSTAPGPSTCTARSTSCAKLWNPSFFDTGSVSQPIPTIDPRRSSTM